MVRAINNRCGWIGTNKRYKQLLNYVTDHLIKTEQLYSLKDINSDLLEIRLNWIQYSNPVSPTILILNHCVPMGYIEWYEQGNVESSKSSKLPATVYTSTIRTTWEFSSTGAALWWWNESKYLRKSEMLLRKILRRIQFNQQWFRKFYRNKLRKYTVQSTF